ncbi:cytochrome c [Undibacter mobilis]|uniref:Cytochrome c n=1 Tax=Undibacter mobilis TaxID=2292256 RepID=A0A371BDS0_9BRAD|nr:cytochrome c [Undibacter mobilis]RDV05735.1 cytochrome c [Undibacter mobilis]
MKRSLVVALAALAVAAGAAHAVEQPYDQIEAGRYQAVLGDCTGCHTAPGGKPFAGGVALDTPFGRLVSPNITPDRATGIGTWNEDDFRNAMKRGIGHNGKRLYPAMPYPAYAKMSDRDIADLWAYLRTLQPATNLVESNQLPFPFNIRLLLAGWNWLNFKPGEFKPDPTKSAEWNRGAYIVAGAGHCGVCHAPKTLLGADKGGMSGTVLQGWLAPNITGNAHEGVGSWSAADIATYLKTGAGHGTIASGPMAEVIEASTSKMTDADLRAIATYLKDLSSPGQAPAPIAADAPGMRAGATIYADTCSACHGGNGAGQAQLFPRLAGNAVVQQGDPTSLIRVVLAGSQGAFTHAAPTTPAMPSLGWRLTDQQVADVLTYVRNVWGNAAPPVAAGTVGTLRKALKEGGS